MTTNGLDQPKRVSVEEYLANEARAEYKSEYHNGIVVPVHRTVSERGEIVAMAGAQPAHNLLVARLGGLLNLCLDNTDCFVFASDQLVFTPDCAKYHYPDLSIACKKPEFEKHTNGLEALLNPSIIIEVLSESTEGYDRGEKFDCYRTLPSFEQYVLVDSTRRRIQTITKHDETHWLMTFAHESDQKVKIGNCEFTIGEVYRKVFLEQ
jgi:Uma2 family endonuclease